jgi:hypothetical protein
MVPERRRSMIVSIAAVVLVVVVALVLARQGATAGASQAPTNDATSSAPASLEPTEGAASPSPTASPTSSPTPTTTPSPSPSSTPTTEPSSAGLTGTWMGTWNVASPSAATGGLRVTWTQQGSDLTGTMIIGKSACAPGGAVEGAVTGDEVVFAVPGTDPVAFTGTLSDATIAGTFMRACDAANGTFSLTRTP